MDLGNLRIHVDHALKTWPTSLDLSHNHTHTHSRCVLISAVSQASLVSNTGRSKILMKNIHHNFKIITRTSSILVVSLVDDNTKVCFRLRN